MPLKNLISYRSSEKERLDIITKQYQKKTSREEIFFAGYRK
jgi:hypothetical protein